MKYKYLIALILFFYPSSLSWAKDPQWIEDTDSDAPTAQLYTSTSFKGQFFGRTGHPFKIDIIGHIDSSKHQVLDSIEILIDHKSMSVPHKALEGIIDFDLGQQIRFRYSENQDELLYIIFPEQPVGEENVAFVFKKGKFWKRQIKVPYGMGVGDNITPYKIEEYP